MVKTNKGTTKKQTTVTKEVVTNTTKKGDTDMYKQACYAIANKVNDRVISTNKKYRTALEKVTAEQVLVDFSKDEQATKALIIIARYLESKYQEQWKEYKLNKVYGKEDKNIMELTDEEREYINKRRARQAKKGGAQ